MSDRMQRLREEMRTWSQRPPRRSAETARSAVLAGIRSASPIHGWKLLATASVAVALFLVSLVQPVPHGSVREEAGGPRATDVGPADSSLMVYRLRSGATLYVVLSTPSETVGAESASRKDG